MVEKNKKQGNKEKRKIVETSEKKVEEKKVEENSKERLKEDNKESDKGKNSDAGDGVVKAGQGKEQKNKEKEDKVGKEEKVEKKETKEKKKEQKKEIPKKDQAEVNALDLGISTKHGVAICNFIRGKTIENAVKDLGEVLKMKKAVPMKGEIPHRKGKGIMSGRYPIKACGVFIKLLRSLNANCAVNGIEEPVIVLAKANKAARPYRRFGQRRFKRSHVSLVAKEVKKKEEEKKEDKGGK